VHLLFATRRLFFVPHIARFYLLITVADVM
jgi:hypothetical protein